MSAKDDILTAIAKTEDATAKVVLLMLLAVLDEISSKIDAMAADEKGLRAAVLNGHESVHHAHHEYIARHIDYEDDDREQHKWVARKIQEELDDAKADKEAKRTIRNNLIERVIWGVLLLLIGASGWVLN